MDTLVHAATEVHPSQHGSAGARGSLVHPYPVTETKGNVSLHDTFLHPVTDGHFLHRNSAGRATFVGPVNDSHSLHRNSAGMGTFVRPVTDGHSLHHNTAGKATFVCL